MKQRYMWLLALVCVVTAVIGGYANYRLIGRTDRDRANAKRVLRLEEYCATVSAAIGMDARELASSDPDRQSAAADRFCGSATYHSEQEILLCSTTPPDLTDRDQCWIARDYTCLAKLARDAAASTKGN